MNENIVKYVIAYFQSWLRYNHFERQYGNDEYSTSGTFGCVDATSCIATRGQHIHII